MTDRVQVSSWVAAYEASWRAPGTAGLTGIFTDDAVYLHTPYEEPVAGLEAIERMWDADRDGPRQCRLRRRSRHALFSRVTGGDAQTHDPAPLGNATGADESDTSNHLLGVGLDQASASTGYRRQHRGNSGPRHAVAAGPEPVNKHPIQTSIWWMVPLLT